MLLAMNRYSVVLLDLMLPGISGEEVLQEIRKQGNTPVIILTAKDTIDDKVEVLQSGADDYVTKPFDIKEVLARVAVQIRRMEGSFSEGNLVYQGLELDRKFLCEGGSDRAPENYKTGVFYFGASFKASEKGIQ